MPGKLVEGYVEGHLFDSENLVSDNSFELVIYRTPTVIHERKIGLPGSQI